MSLKSEGGTQAQDPQLVAIEEEINEVKDDIKQLKAQIKAFEDGKTPKDEFSKQSYLKWQDCLIEDKKRLNGLEARRERLEADLRVLRARQSSSATSTAQQGK